MLAVTHSSALSGIEAHPVEIEVNTDLEGEPKLFVVGLPDVSVRESQDRVHSAIINSGFKTPFTKTIINLAPGDLRKEGPSFDLPIALGILAATDQLKKQPPTNWMVAGELSLSGEMRPIKGALPMAILAKKTGKNVLLLPPHSAEEASIVEGVSVYSVKSLSHACKLINEEVMAEPLVSNFGEMAENLANSGLDFEDI
ncbi:MAG: hypothetical protein MI748_20535, partial [Opitutales bacterium]|nr:hypothetical protein [Opitutales bacterium]